ncbi:hypothetical protein [Nonomuraea sp. NPDC049158]|uniref:aromatic-ring hydroxylase C-terminal domain-containing protein n=1 Tax=Nonomuraea sp. NPDC049158 TaxID=3155649 RepID=UPI0033F66E01
MSAVTRRWSRWGWPCCGWGRCCSAADPAHRRSAPRRPLKILWAKDQGAERVDAAVLIRPDGYVAWVARSGRTDLTRSGRPSRPGSARSGDQVALPRAR